MSNKLELTADQLLTLLHSSTGVHRDALLQLCGAQITRKQPRTDRTGAAPVGQGTLSAETVQQTDPLSEEAVEPQVYWQLISRTVQQISRVGQSTTTEKADVKAVPDAQMLEIANQQWLCRPAALQHLLVRQHVEKTPDATAIAYYWYRCLAKAQTPQQRFTPTMSSDASVEWIVVADYSLHLMHWWDDIRALSGVLGGLFGKMAVRDVAVRYTRRKLRLLQHNASWPTFGKHTRVIVASDAGVLQKDSAIAAAWQEQLDRWQHAGVDATVLLPHGDNASVGFQALAWGDHWVIPESRSAQCVEDILACLSIVQWSSWALLRYWRRIFGAPASVEFLIRHHPAVWAEPSGCVLKRKMGHYRTGFSAFPPDRQQLLLAPADKLRAGVARWVVKEEAMVRESLGIDRAGGARAIIAGLTAHGSEPSDEELAWLYDLSQRQDEQFWRQLPQLRDLCIAAGKKLYGDAAQVPRELTRNTILATRTEVAVFASAEGLSTTTATSPGCRVASIEVEESLQIDSGQGARRIAADDTHTVNADIVVLASKSERLEIQRASKPPWAVRIEQSSKGLIATLEDDRQLLWCAAGGAHEHLLKRAPGAWIDRDQIANAAYAESLTAGDAPDEGDVAYPHRKRTVAIDESRSLSMNLRWIPPGEFTMGSPQSEAGRYPNEQSHQVIISQGFWMMDSVCTQQLWQAVLQDNPSHFSGETKPVENVSWEDVVEKFIPALNRQVSDFHFRLPTEAEWEYACRAGTETAFNTGDRLSVEQARYLGHINGVKAHLEHTATQQRVEKAHGGKPNDKDWARWLRVPIEAIKAARSEDSNYFKVREGTCDVMEFEPNEWGLYQMHGNVWEWCVDEVGAELPVYPATTNIDPKLKSERSTGRGRVVRGGSWVNFGSDLRSAMRIRLTAVYRVNSLGFRLVTGPRQGGAGSSASAATSEADGAERKSRRGSGTGKQRNKRGNNR